MDTKVRELVALGASYALNCRPCMEFHKKLAVEAGLTDEEMLAAIRVAEAVRKGAGKRTREYADGLFGAVKEERYAAGSACCA